MDKIKKIGKKVINTIAGWTLENIKSDSIYNIGKVIFIYVVFLLILITLITR